ncbi:MAG TPA: histidinol-phosphate transaminase [Spirochaetia bacterium]|nr:histidinol-phosphate transaminase [Spirochaetia bacterium]
MKAEQEALAFVRGAVRRMDGYVPGLQPGPGQALIKLNSNENPYPPSPRVIEALHAAVSESLRLYPNPDSTPLREQAARLYGLAPSQVLCGNGSDEILALLMRTFVAEGDTVAWFQPSYSLYPVLAEISRARVRTVPMPRVAQQAEMASLPVPSPRAKMFFLTTPNAPYGPAFPTAWVDQLLKRFRGIVVTDEAYVDFSDESTLPLLAANPRLIIVRTLSKAYSLAGMRAGLAFAHESLIQEIAKVKDSYNVSRMAQVAACAALEDQEYFRSCREKLVATRERFSQALRARGFTVLPSSTNFIFAVPPAGQDAGTLYEKLLARGYLVRHWKTGIVSDGLRISIGTDQQMDGLTAALQEA